MMGSPLPLLAHSALNIDPHVDSQRVCNKGFLYLTITLIKPSIIYFGSRSVFFSSLSYLSVFARLAPRRVFSIASSSSFYTTSKVLGPARHMYGEYLLSITTSSHCTYIRTGTEVDNLPFLCILCTKCFPLIYYYEVTVLIRVSSLMSQDYSKPINQNFIVNYIARLAFHKMHVYARIVTHTVFSKFCEQLADCCIIYKHSLSSVVGQL